MLDVDAGLAELVPADQRTHEWPTPRALSYRMSARAVAESVPGVVDVKVRP